MLRHSHLSLFLHCIDLLMLAGITTAHRGISGGLQDVMQKSDAK